MDVCTLYINKPAAVPNKLNEGGKPDILMYVWVSIGVVLTLGTSLTALKCYIKHNKGEETYGRNDNHIPSHHFSKEFALPDASNKTNATSLKGQDHHLIFNCQ